MLSRVVTEHPALQITKHKFQEPGHIHLECHSDHAHIEIAKKSTTAKIWVPQDWYLYIQSVRGKTQLKFVEMRRGDFLSLSILYQKCLMKNNMDSTRQKFSSFQIHLDKIWDGIWGVSFQVQCN
jgi:hypothetical protein